MNPNDNPTEPTDENVAELLDSAKRTYEEGVRAREQREARIAVRRLRWGPAIKVALACLILATAVALPTLLMQARIAAIELELTSVRQRLMETSAELVRIHAQLLEAEQQRDLAPVRDFTSLKPPTPNKAQRDAGAANGISTSRPPPPDKTEQRDDDAAEGITSNRRLRR